MQRFDWLILWVFPQQLFLPSVLKVTALCPHSEENKIFGIHNNREWANFFSVGTSSVQNRSKTTFYARFS
ncbi:hypothetical protein IKO50_05655, partial [bacterium]|nr:hypothetical protein [bacterium]